MNESERTSPEHGVHYKDAATISGLGKNVMRICALFSGTTTGLMMIGNVIHDNPVFEQTAEQISLTAITASASVGFAGLQRFYQNRVGRIQNSA